MRKLLTGVVVLLLILGAGFMFLLSRATPDKAPEEDIVIELDLPESM
ncbi:MAG: hypothetical protein GDA39_03285 [Hyphomonadaceae bacterium]|nr:hypothetical protein [Hyphomonadaceae bacterium]